MTALNMLYKEFAYRAFEIIAFPGLDSFQTGDDPIYVLEHNKTNAEIKEWFFKKNESKF